VLRAKDDISTAIDVLSNALEFNPGSYPMHYAIAQSIRASAPDADTVKADTLLYHFQRSFSRGDKNYEALFWYARQLCLCGQQSTARPIFEALKKIAVPYDQKRAARGPLLNSGGSEATLYGVVYNLNHTYGFIRADLNSMEVYFEFSKEMVELEALKINDRVSLNLAFTLAGPRASNIKPV
jgi:cold shock CspA family protein